MIVILLRQPDHPIPRSTAFIRCERLIAPTLVRHPSTIHVPRKISAQQRTCSKDKTNRSRQNRIKAELHRILRRRISACASMLTIAPCTVLRPAAFIPTHCQIRRWLTIDNVSYIRRSPWNRSQESSIPILRTKLLPISPAGTRRRPGAILRR